MSGMRAEALLVRFGPHLVAVELKWISTVLTLGDSSGMERLDPRPYLFSGAEGRWLEDREEIRVGLLRMEGPPAVVVLGEVVGTGWVGRKDLLRLPGWLTAGMPEILYGACALWEEKIVWLLDVGKLREVEWK